MEKISKNLWEKIYSQRRRRVEYSPAHPAAVSPLRAQRRLDTPNRQLVSSHSTVRHPWNPKYAYGYTCRIFNPPVGMTTPYVLFGECRQGKVRASGRMSMEKISKNSGKKITPNEKDEMNTHLPTLLL
jgi:hypothetical protein